MTYAIGDIHGSLEKLNDLIDRLPADDLLVFLGDYLDKGPNSREVIDCLISISKERPCRFLIGNHEYVWLEHLKFGKRQDFLNRFGGLATLASYCGENSATSFSDLSDLNRAFASHMGFLTSLEPFVIGENWVCVHGGISPDFGDEDLLTHNLEKLVFLRFERTASDNSWRGKSVICGHSVVGGDPVAGQNTIAIDTGAWMDEGRLTALNLNDFSYLQDNGETGILVLDECSK